jgi:hypothetical protein
MLALSVRLSWWSLDYDRLITLLVFLIELLLVVVVVISSVT